MATNIVSWSIDEEIYQKIKTFYIENQKVPSNDYVLFMAKTSDCTITIYKSYKAVFQGKDALNEAMIFGYTNDNNWLFTDSHAGSDEVGTGDYFGPIVVCASYVDQKSISEIEALGIKDSKKLSDGFISDIVPKIIKKYPHSILVLDNEKYNVLIRQGWNMNSLKAALHNKALSNLNKKKGGINYFVIDQFCAPNNYYQYLKDSDEVIRNVKFETKGESKSAAVALSSIIARYTFLKKMEELKKKSGYDLPLGAGNLVDEMIQKILKERGMEFLKKIAKVNFKNTAKNTQERLEVD